MHFVTSVPNDFVIGRISLIEGPSKPSRFILEKLNTGDHTKCILLQRGINQAESTHRRSIKPFIFVGYDIFQSVGLMRKI